MDNLNELLRLISYETLCKITGKLLGDGNLTIETKRSPRLRFSHKLEDFEWCDHCYKDLAPD